jgi:hypothetical protein
MTPARLPLRIRIIFALDVIAAIAFVIAIAWMVRTWPR